MRLGQILEPIRSEIGKAFRRLPGNSLTIGPPRAAIASAEAWYASLDPADQLRHNVHKLYPERSVHRAMPVYADEPIRQLFEKMQSGTIAPRIVAEIDNGRYWGRWFGYIIAPGDVLIADISPNLTNFGMPLVDVEKHDALRQPFLPRAQSIDGTVLSLNTLFCSNFHHFLLDTLPKIDLVLRSGIRLEDIDHFVFDYQNNPHQNETLNRLGIPPHKIITSHPGLHLHCKKLIVPSYSEPGARVDKFHYTEEGVQFVRQLFLSEKPIQRRRILLSRRLAKERRWIQEEKSLPELTKLSFERFELENLPIEAQAKLFSEAECILMPHGGGLANTVFCSPGTQVVELFGSFYLPTFMMPLSDRLKLKYHALVADPQPIADEQRDIDISADRVVSYVRSIL